MIFSKKWPFGIKFQKKNWLNWYRFSVWKLLRKLFGWLWAIYFQLFSFRNLKPETCSYPLHQASIQHYSLFKLWHRGYIAKCVALTLALKSAGLSCQGSKVDVTPFRRQEIKNETPKINPVPLFLHHLKFPKGCVLLAFCPFVSSWNLKPDTRNLGFMLSALCGLCLPRSSGRWYWARDIKLSVSSVQSASGNPCPYPSPLVLLTSNFPLRTPNFSLPLAPFIVCPIYQGRPQGRWPQCNFTSFFILHS